MGLGKQLLALEVKYKKRAIDPNTSDVERSHCNRMIAIIKSEVKRLGL